jgi:hypothetical protein
MRLPLRQPVSTLRGVPRHRCSCSAKAVRHLSPSLVPPPLLSPECCPSPQHDITRHFGRYSALFGSTNSAHNSLHHPHIPPTTPFSLTTISVSRYHIELLIQLGYAYTPTIDTARLCVHTNHWHSRGYDSHACGSAKSAQRVWLLCPQALVSMSSHKS